MDELIAKTVFHHHKFIGIAQLPVQSSQPFTAKLHHSLCHCHCFVTLAVTLPCCAYSINLLLQFKHPTHAVLPPLTRQDILQGLSPRVTFHTLPTHDCGLSRWITKLLSILFRLHWHHHATTPIPSEPIIPHPSSNITCAPLTHLLYCTPQCFYNL